MRPDEAGDRVEEPWVVDAGHRWGIVGEPPVRQVVERDRTQQVRLAPRRRVVAVALLQEPRLIRCAVEQGGGLRGSLRCEHDRERTSEPRTESDGGLDVLIEPLEPLPDGVLGGSRERLHDEPAEVIEPLRIVARRGVVAALDERTEADRERVGVDALLCAERLQERVDEGLREVVVLKQGLRAVVGQLTRVESEEIDLRLLVLQVLDPPAEDDAFPALALRDVRPLRGDDEQREPRDEDAVVGRPSALRRGGRGLEPLERVRLRRGTDETLERQGQTDAGVVRIVDDDDRRTLRIERPGEERLEELRLLLRLLEVEVLEVLDVGGSDVLEDRRTTVDDLEDRPDHVRAGEDELGGPFSDPACTSPGARQSIARLEVDRLVVLQLLDEILQVVIDRSGTVLAARDAEPRERSSSAEHMIVDVAHQLAGPGQVVPVRRQVRRREARRVERLPVPAGLIGEDVVEALHRVGLAMSGLGEDPYHGHARTVVGRQRSVGRDEAVEECVAREWNRGGGSVLKHAHAPRRHPREKSTSWDRSPRRISDATSLRVRRTIRRDHRRRSSAGRS